MPGRFEFDVFLSYNAKDRRRVRQLARRLRNEGLTVWFDEWSVGSGELIARKVDEGLERSRVLVLCISPNALASQWVALEWNTAISRDPANIRRRFVPLLLVDCDLPNALRRYKYVDFRKHTAEGFRELLAACRAEGIEGSPKRGTARKDKVGLMVVFERKLTGHQDRVTSLAVTPKGSVLASGATFDHSVRIWDLETGECRRTLKGHLCGLGGSIAFSGDGQNVLFTGDDGTVHVSNIRSGETSAIDVYADIIPPQPRPRSMIVAVRHGLEIFDLETRRSKEKIIHPWKDLRGLACSANRFDAVTVEADGRLRRWDLKSAKQVESIKVRQPHAWCVCITQCGKVGFTGAADGIIRIFHDGRMAGTLEGHKNAVHSVAISPDGGLLASTGFVDQTVRLWNWKSRKCLEVINHQENVFPVLVAFTRGNPRRLVVGTMEGSIYIYRVFGVRAALLADPIPNYVGSIVALLGETIPTRRRQRIS